MAKRNVGSSSSPRVRKPRKSRKPVSGIDAIVKLAATVNPANVLDVIAATTGNHTTTTRNIGRFTLRRIVDFQNWSLEQNAAWQLDDCQLAFVWSVEYPGAVGRVFGMNALPGVRPTPNAAAIRDAISIVRGVRSDFNRGKHANTVPAVPSESYGSRRFDIRGTEHTNAPVRKTA